MNTNSKLYERAMVAFRTPGVGFRVTDPSVYGRYKLSVQDGPTHYCTPGVTAEIAIFRDGDWLVSANFPPELQEFGPLFEAWGREEPPDTEVAGHVPLATIERIREVLTALAQQEAQP